MAATVRTAILKLTHNEAVVKITGPVAGAATIKIETGTDLVLPPPAWTTAAQKSGWSGSSGDSGYTDFDLSPTSQGLNGAMDANPYNVVIDKIFFSAAPAAWSLPAGSGFSGYSAAMSGFSGVNTAWSGYSAYPSYSSY